MNVPLNYNNEIVHVIYVMSCLRNKEDLIVS